MSLIVLIVSLFSLAGCGDSFTHVQVPWPQPDGRYKVQPVRLNTLRDPKTVSGSAASIRLNPSILKSQIQGGIPSARFSISKDNVLIPSGYQSLQMFTVYAHFEHLQKLDRLSGVSEHLRYPRLVGLELNARFNNQKGINNALYSSDWDAIMVFPYTISQLLPFSLNAGVLAHEHFHSVYEAYVGRYLSHFNRVSECLLSPAGGFISHKDNSEDKIRLKKAMRVSAQEIYSEMLIKAWNEGLADVWGWIYTGSGEFIFDSTGDTHLSQQRDLDGPIVQLYDDDELMGVAEFSATAQNDEWRFVAYLVGTQYARFIKAAALAQDHDLEPRESAAKFIASVLPLLKARVQKADYMTPDLLLEVMLLKMQTPESPWELNQAVCLLANKLSPTTVYAMAPRCRL